MWKREKAAISASTRGSGAKGRGAGDLQGDDLEELDVAVDTFVQFPKLRIES